MKKAILKWFSLLIVGLLVGCFTAFVAQCYWNWFAVETLHFSPVSFLQMLGVLWLIQIVTAKSSSGGDNKRWEVLIAMVELCIPPEKQDDLSELKEDTASAILPEGFFMAFGQIASNIFMLVIGFALHQFV